MNLIWLGFGESLTALHVCIVSCSSHPNFTIGSHYCPPGERREKAIRLAALKYETPPLAASLFRALSQNSLYMTANDRPRSGGRRRSSTSKPSVNTDLKVRLKSGRKRKVCRLLPKKLLKGHPSVSGARPLPAISDFREAQGASKECLQRCENMW